MVHTYKQNMATLWLQSQYLCSLWNVKNKSFISISHILFFKINLWYKLGHHFLIIKLKQLHPHLTSLSGCPVFLLGTFFFSKVFQCHFLRSASAQHKKGGPLKSAHLAIKGGSSSSVNLVVSPWRPISARAN